MVYLRLIVTALCPVFITAVLYLINKNTRFGQWNKWVKQAVYGLVFGMVAILSTELGVQVDGAVINSRDAAPLTAGLLFGAPAGIISGLIGGVERWYSVLWGTGEYMRFAGAASTCFAGFFGAALRYWMFDDKKPSWQYGFATGFIMEVIHMLMLFFTNMNDVKTAFTFVQTCFFPMILSNSLAVMLAVMVVMLLGQERLQIAKEHRKLTQTFSRWLLVVVLVSFVITSIFTFILQTSFSSRNNEGLLKLNIEDVRADIKDASNENLLRLTREVAKELDEAEKIDNELVLEMCNRQENDFAEINVIDKDGFIRYSNTPAFFDFDMGAGEQSGAFLVLLSGMDELVQDYMPITAINNVYMKYAGVRLKRGGFVQVGYDGERFRKDIDQQVIGVTRNRHVGESGYMLIAAEDWNIVSDERGNEGKNLKVTGIFIDESKMKEGVRYVNDIYGEECYWMYTKSEGYYIIAVEPVSQVLFGRNLSVYLTVSMGILIFTVIFILLYFLVKKLVVENIHEINHTLKEITGGNLNVSVDVRTNEEFISLSNDINTTVATLKGYIAQAAARIDKELEMAKIIQTSTLPNIFPPYPERTDFDIFASMDTAKEVGGDFYDFYLLDENRLAFLIADVSGKGITAAMFMMKAKTLIKGYADKENQVVDIMTKANEALCEGNDAEMFVTCWMGILNFTTHTVTYVNAGHNPPLVRHQNGKFEYFKSRPGFVLAGMEGIRYRQETLELRPGDTIYMYTDGITEATDVHNELYGEERLINIVNSVGNISSRDLCHLVKNDVDQFVGEAPQFDDMTMICIRLMPKNVIVLKPTAPESMTQALEFVENALTEAEIPMKIVMKMNIAVDEIFSNIKLYSGANEAEIECYVHDGHVTLIFTDNGKPYNPLETEDPDTTLDADERQIGGLGIFMVKKSMDNVTYIYRDNRNVLTLDKEYV